ncbi:MAG: hypothetical protein MUE42_06840, partial [Opitutaceae bacterium]|nr:hypothetical protein [Opitutaceae bacterium]
MDFLNQPFQRDTSPNSAGEILRRLGVVAHIVGLFLGPILLGLGSIRADRGLLIAGGALLGVGLALQFTRARWKPGHAPATSPRPPAQPAAVTPLSPATAGHRPRLLLLNASLAGPEGNSARLLRRMAARLAPHAELVGASLAGP